MAFEIIVTEVFQTWYEELSEPEQDSVGFVVDLLQDAGPQLSFPYSSGINGSKFSHMRELRIKHQGRPYRVLYAFDPLRQAILLIGGDKSGDDRWYETTVPKADRLYADYLKDLKR